MTIADKIIDKCGGITRTAELARCSENWVYRWRLPQSKGGTGGHVPAKAQKALIDAAMQGLCSVKPADFFEGAA